MSLKKLWISVPNKKNKEYDNRCTFAFVAATRHDGRWPGDKNMGKESAEVAVRWGGATDVAADFDGRTDYG